MTDRTLRIVTFAVGLATALVFMGQRGNSFSTKAQQEFAAALTSGGIFGVPRYTTVLLPTCGSVNTGAVAFDTTTTTPKACNGTAWQTLGTGTGTFVTGSGTTNILPKFTTGASGIIGDSTVSDDGTIVTLNTRTTAKATMTGAASTSNFLNVTGTYPSTLSGAAYGTLLSMTGAGSSSQENGALASTYNAGYAGSSATFAGRFVNVALSTGSVAIGTYGGNNGLITATIGAGAGTKTGIYSFGTDSTTANYGGIFIGSDGASPTINLGAAGIGGGGASGSPSRVGLYGGFGAFPASWVTAAALLDNVNSTSSTLFVARSNSAALPTTGPTATFSLGSTAIPQAGNTVLTSATMTAETQGQLRSSTHSYTWTNAQVVALGAALTGDITVATLPAKTIVSNAYVVITGAAVGPATVTVSCGDAIGGTPFINWIVASDAKAAANTVYGDASAERGTSIDTEFFYLPSYTATTLVTCHFISTVATLDAVTGSTGRVIVETTLAP